MSGSFEQVVGTAERERIEREALRERERALLANELLMAPGPYEAHVGFSNVCNMSCIMCWDGANPPARKMSDELVAKLSEQVAPSLSVITPYNGSEPLIVSWDATRELAERYAVELTITTNGQFLDERHFRELRDITETLFISIDSHIPEMFEKIRPGGKPARIYENLGPAVAAAREHGLECLVNIVFLTENGPLLAETIDYLADVGVEAVHVMQMLDVNGRSGFSNPLVHFSPAYVALLKKRCVATAKRRGIRLVWDVEGNEDHDFRARPTAPKARKVAYDHWDWRMKHHLPGFCRNAYDRLRIDTEGNVAPCSYSTDGELELGNLAETSFEEMWNGPRIQDLRRAHYTWDYPSICSACRFKDPVPPRDEMPFLWDIFAGLRMFSHEVEPSIELLGPAHMKRGRYPPVLRFVQPRTEVDHLFVALALGGESDEIEIWAVPRGAREGGCVEFPVPRDAWQDLRPNVGWWWAVMGFSSSEPSLVLRSSEVRCLIRHRPMPRIADSGLRYPDGQARPVVDLGSVAAGNGTRPKLERRREGDPWGTPRRHVKHRKERK